MLALLIQRDGSDQDNETFLSLIKDASAIAASDSLKDP